jgi:hypothetical protein
VQVVARPHDTHHRVAEPAQESERQPLGWGHRRENESRASVETMRATPLLRRCWRRRAELSSRLSRFPAKRCSAALCRESGEKRKCAACA